MTKKTMIAPVGGSTEGLFIGIREYPVEKLILLVPEGKEKTADDVEEDIGKFKIEVERVSVKGEDLWEEMFQRIAEIKKSEGSDNVVVNVASGDKLNRCIAVSASFVNGLKAMTVIDEEAVLLPVLKFSYYKALTDKKMTILKTIFDNEDCCSSLDELSERLDMSLPLVSYHVNGNRKSDGLKDLGLAQTRKEKGKTQIELTTLGRLLVKGYV